MEPKHDLPNGQVNATLDIGTSAQIYRLQMESAADIYLSNRGGGIILKSPDGKICKLLTIDNTGKLVLRDI